MVFTGDGSHEIREFPVPEPPDGGAVLQVEAVGLCGSDVAQHAGVHLIPGTERVPGGARATRRSVACGAWGATPRSA